MNTQNKDYRTARVAADRPQNTQQTGETRFRLTIGHDEMNQFAGLSDGDLFRANNRIYKVRPTSGGWTLRPYDNILGEPLKGFEIVPDYQTFVYLVNQAAVNGLES